MKNNKSVPNFRASIGLALWLAAFAAAASPSDAATLRVLAQTGQYSQPYGITEGAPGLFYFVGDVGTDIVSITTKGYLTQVAAFQHPPYIIFSAPISGSNGLFYSSIEGTQNVNNGYVFSFTSAPGSQTYSAQSFAPAFTQNLPDGNLLTIAYPYATTSTILAETTLGGEVMAPIYRFPSGEQVAFDALYATDGNYYGTSVSANKTAGYVYQITPSGSLTKLLNIPIPASAYVLQAGDGNLYGVTGSNGKPQAATIFKLTLGGQYALLHTFPAGTSGNVAMLIEGSDGKIYGATNGNGGVGSRIFSMTTSGQYAVVYEMNANQGQCPCTLVQGSDGVVYGTAQMFGTTGGGTIFALDAGLPKPAPQAKQFQPQSGSAGTQVQIWGSNLLSAKVTFNGVAARDVSSSGPNYVLATVPARATSGPIMVTTPGGTSTTAASFTVQ